MAFDDKQLKALEELEAKASGGKWYAPKDGQRLPKTAGTYSDNPVFHVQHAASYEVWAESMHFEEYPGVAFQCFEEDAKFIAAVRNAFPDIVARIKEAEEEIRCSHGRINNLVKLLDREHKKVLKLRGK